MTQPNNYKIGDICRDTDGNYRVYWYGEHVEQGGSTFKRGSLGSNDIEELLKVVGSNIQRCEDIYDDYIKEREDEIYMGRQKYRNSSRDRKKNER
jgi:hypothetical protein